MCVVSLVLFSLSHTHLCSPLHSVLVIVIVDVIGDRATQVLTHEDCLGERLLLELKMMEKSEIAHKERQM